VSALEALGGDVEGALENINVPSYVLDPSGVIRWINPAAVQIFGDVRGRQFTSIVAPEDRRRAREVFAQKISGTVTVTDAEVVLLGARGERLTVDVSSVPLRHGDQIIGVFGQGVLDLEHPPPTRILRSHPARLRFCACSSRGARRGRSPRSCT